MVDFEIKDNYNIEDYIRLMKVLRSPDGCPWDREQTHESIRRNFIEEVCEAVEAIDEQSPEHLCEELGDVLMQVLFHAGIEEDRGGFTIDDVCDTACKKLILRHPHVFGDTVVSGSEDVLKNWDDIKRKEKNQKTVTESMDAVARTLPALWRAEKVQKKAAKVGFDWPDITGALDKLAEELTELSDAVCDGQNIEEELGDVLFSAVNIARFAHVDPETALNKTNDKFIRRFAYIEDAAEKKGADMSAMTLEEMEELYQEGKCKGIK